MLTADELERYARHIVLRDVGGPGQAALRRARVLVIGAGGLGAPLMLYLAAAGVGTLGVVDEGSEPTVDLIVADLRLADGQSGIDAISCIRAHLGAGVPALVVSGDTSGDAQDEVRAAGIRLLVKPVVAAAFRSAAEDVIRRRATSL